MSDDPNQEHVDFRLHAALDGEIDAMGMLDWERALAADPTLAARYATLAALRGSLRSHADRLVAPPSLRARVSALVKDAAAPRPRRTFFAFAAAIALAFVAGGLATTLLDRVRTSLTCRYASRRRPPSRAAGA